MAATLSGESQVRPPPPVHHGGKTGQCHRFLWNPLPFLKTPWLFVDRKQQASTLIRDKLCLIPTDSSYSSSSLSRMTEPNNGVVFHFFQTLPGAIINHTPQAHVQKINKTSSPPPPSPLAPCSSKLNNASYWRPPSSPPLSPPYTDSLSHLVPSAVFCRLPLLLVFPQDSIGVAAQGAKQALTLNVVTERHSPSVDWDLISG